MTEEEKIKISVNEEDIQNLINCYKKDIEYIMQLEKENKKYKEVIDKLKRYIEKCLKLTPTDDRTKSDDVLDNEYEYLLKILKEVE